MLTPIETLLFSSGSAHVVVEILQADGRLIVSVAPRANLGNVKVAEFTEVKFTSIEVCGDGPDDLNLPWDIIGFDGYRLSELLWEFVLHCIGIEYGFQARWPEARIL